MSNNSQTDVRNVVKICFQAICEVNFMIPLKNFGFYIEKTKVRLRPTHVDGLLRKILKHQTGVDNNP